MEMPWVVGYGVVIVPGVVAVWADTRVDQKEANNAVAIVSAVSRTISPR